VATIALIAGRHLGRDDAGDGTFSLTGGAEEPDVKETASQTYGVAAPVYKDSNGTIAVCSHGTNQISSGLLGLAIKAATGTTGALAYVKRIRVGDLLVLNKYSGGSKSVTALTDVGTAVGLDIISGVMVGDVATAATTLPYGVCVGLYTVANGYMDGDVVGDTGGRIIVRVMPNVKLQS
jgi:hypothetical protein